MGVSNILDKKYNKKGLLKTDAIKCIKDVTDCMFISNNGMCSAEWCIFQELPKVIDLEKDINCIFCDKPKTVSIYNSDSWYICDDCIRKMKEIINERK